MSRKSWLKRWKVWKDNPESMDPPRIHCLRMVHGTRTYTHTENNHDHHDSTTVLSYGPKTTESALQNDESWPASIAASTLRWMFHLKLGPLGHRGWLVRTCMRTMQGHLYIHVYIYIYVYVYVCYCMYVHIYIYVDISLFVYLFVYLSIYSFIDLSTCTHTCIYI